MKVRIHFMGKIRSLPTLVSGVVAKARRAATHTAGAAAAVFISPLSFIQFKPLLIVLSIALVSCLVAAKQASGQSGPANAVLGEIKPLKIGDKVPDELWDQYFLVVSADNEQTQLLSLGDFKDKLIILDFWATWCAPCISSLYKLDTLQKDFKDELMIVPTTYEPEEKARKFFGQKGWQLPTLVDETTLKKYFPYRSIPHQVWIKDGKVIAITGPEYISTTVINDVLNNQNVSMVVKNENLNFNPSQPKGLINADNEILFHTIFTNKVNIENSGISRRNNLFVIYNSSIPKMIQEVYKSTIPSYSIKNRTILEVSDSLKSQMFEPSKILNDPLSIELLHKWRNENLYSYSVYCEKNLSQNVFMDLFKEDLNRFLKYQKRIKAEIQTRKLRGWALVQSSHSTKKVAGITTGDLFKKLLFLTREWEQPLVNELSEVLLVDIDLEKLNSNIYEIRKYLELVGLDLIEKEIEIEMLVIKDYNND